MSPRSGPVLLLGAGQGEATCGILYLAGYLRRNGIETYVRLWDGDGNARELKASLEALLARVRPRMVGISLKWFHHVHRALQIARAIRAIDPQIEIVVGGNSASYWWRELATFDCIDKVILGDGELPLLAVARGDPSPPNIVTHDPDGSPRRLPLKYVQSTANSADVYYSHFDEIFLSQMDVHAFSGWIAPGKGCGENCLYCGGARGNQKAAFGRAKPFLRDEESVRKDHREVVGRAWELRYDFSGSSAAFLNSTWTGVDLSRHACTYFLWGVPPPGLVDALAGAFERVFMVLDVGCFSEQQRLKQMKLGLLKTCCTDKELFALIDACRKHRNVEVEVSGIAGLPFASTATLKEELQLAKRITELGCVVGYQRLEAQPGALATEHPARFEMHTEAKAFKEFVDYFERRPDGDNSVPMIRFDDQKLEAAVQRNCDEVVALASEHQERKQRVHVSERTKLRNTAPATEQFRLGEWFGQHRVPSRVAAEPVTVVRSVNGTVLVCAPTVAARRFSDRTMAQGEDAATLLRALATFDRPTPVGAAVSALQKTARLDPDSAREVIEHLVDGRFLQPV